MTTTDKLLRPPFEVVHEIMREETYEAVCYELIDDFLKTHYKDLVLNMLLYGSPFMLVEWDKKKAKA